MNPRVYGVICVEMFDQNLVDDPEFVSALIDLRFKTFLYPGGSISYYHHPKGTGGFNIRPEEVARSRHGAQSRFMKHGLGPDHFEQYIQFVKASGGEAVFVANILNGTVEELEEFLTRLQAEQIPIACVILGVEMHLGQARDLGVEGYAERIKPYIAMLQAKYPSLPIVADGTPVGRVDSRPGDVVLASFHEWNQRLAKLPGISGFSQYGWTEFEEGQGSPSGLSQDRATDPVDLARRLTQYYDPFVSNLPSRQIAVYQADWGPEMKMHMTQWGTHHDGNTVLQGLHVANFYFFLAEYNAAHDDYFQTAISAFILADKAANPRDRDPMFGGGLLYKKNILLRSPYLYTKPFRYLFSGDKALLETSINGAVQDGSFATLKALAARGPDRKKYIYILNRGPATSCGTISIDGEEMPAETRGQVECVWGESLAAVPGKEGFETYSGERSLAGLAIPPYSLTVIIVP